MCCRIARATALFLVCLPATAIAAIGPDFTFGYSAWKSTDVVVVDTRGQVRDVWKGGMKAGDRLPIRAFKLPESAKVHYYWPVKGASPNTSAPIKVVTGTTRVLFLIRDASKPISDVEAWTAASIGERMEVAAVWLERGETFAIRQLMNPGSSLMSSLRMSEGDLKKEILRLAALQRSLRDTAKDPDAASRARKMVPLLDEELVWALNDTLDVLKGCRKDAWPVIKSLLEDDKRLSIHSELIHASGDACLAEAIPTMEKIIAAEMTYWDAYRTSRENGKSAQDPWHAHYDRLGACLCVLQYKAKAYRDPNGVVAKLREQFRASPTLLHLGAGPIDPSPLVKYADAILERRE